MLSGSTAEPPDENGATDPPEDQKPEEDASKSSCVADTNIRVAVGLLDKLMDLVGELALTRNQILQLNNGREDAALNAMAQRLNLITTELQAGVMKTRTQPIGVVWNKLPRVVRDMEVVSRQTDPAGDGRRGDRARPDHHRGHQRPTRPPCSKFL